MIRRATAIVLLLAIGAACSGADDAAPATTALPPEDDALCLDAAPADRPVVELIAPALDLARELFDDPELYEVSADRQRVSVIVAASGGEAQQLLLCRAGYVPATSLGPADGATFTADAVELDPATIFDGIDAELDAPDIVDVAVIGDGQGNPVYDARIQSSAGGTLLVRLTPSGEVLGVQAE